ncbi:hypothetical protein Vadar_016930 [Vaccinium darrowii]|uniref:Uncharacterized protein n=1 Tax=Vaccinium darrowii TaxID=229202 RepID=A0ACB7X1G0_9ERIC|nr:hypothetical protein Vadar_016930 [Vaccinium darrowii]
MEPVRRKKGIKRVEDETTCPYIPEGILVCILAKLPVKSLLQFRCVSKNWRSLISDSKFNLSTQRQQVIVMSMPVRQSKYQKSVFVHLIDDEASVKELPMPEPLRGALAFGGPDLWGSCNGLVLSSTRMQAAAARYRETMVEVILRVDVSTWMLDIGSSLPPGFKFYPSDEELVCHYLSKKIANQEVLKGTLVEIDLHQIEPWQLPAMMLQLSSGDGSTHLNSGRGGSRGGRRLKPSLRTTYKMSFP